MPDLPIACTLDDAALRERREGLLAKLGERAAEQQALSNGRRLRFTADTETLALIGRVIEAERRCCQFLRFQLTVEADRGPVLLDLTGPAGTREFLDSIFSPA
jgi:hypothetical protein